MLISWRMIPRCNQWDHAPSWGGGRSICLAFWVGFLGGPFIPPSCPRCLVGSLQVAVAGKMQNMVVLNGDEYHGIESVKKHQLNKQKVVQEGAWIRFPLEGY